MKFQRQRINQLITDNYEPNNQQFLTFRNNPGIENTGRSVFSQQFDYRSLEKYQNIDQEPQPISNFRKNMKQIRSQQKYKQLRQEAMLPQLSYQNHEGRCEEMIEKNRDLKRKQNRLVKKIKGEERRRMDLQSQIQKILAGIEENEELLMKQKSDIEELEEIKDENQGNLLDMEQKIREFEDQAREYEQQVSQMNNSLQFQAKSIETARNKAKQFNVLDINKQLLDGIQELTFLSDKLSQKIEIFDKDIQVLREQLDALKYLDAQFQQFSY